MRNILLFHQNIIKWVWKNNVHVKLYIIGFQISLATTIFGQTNVALNKPITASSDAGNSFVAGNANDGNVNTYWQGENGYPNSIVVNLGAQINICKIVLKLNTTWGSRNQTLSVQSSQNGISYSPLVNTDFYTFDPVSSNIVTINFTSVKTQYVKLEMTANTGSSGAQIGEFEVDSTQVDVQAPNIPAGLASSLISSSCFVLSWTPSTDNIGVVEYEIMKNGVSYGKTRKTSISIAGLGSSSTYAMKVKACDALGNWSGESTALNVTTIGGAITINNFINASYNGIMYRLFVPKNYNPSTKYPLVLYLHGAGSRGNDNTIQCDEWPMIFAQDSNQSRWPSFVLSPQCPSNDQWVNTPWANGSYSTSAIPISTDLSTVNSIISLIQSKYNIDPSRLYCTGLSMGGYGTWDIITRFSDKFAAAIPICGAGDPSKAVNIKNIPLRFYHSSDDDVVPVSGSRDMNTALTNAGAIDAVYKEYTGMGHGSWNAAYKDPGLLPWLFSKTKSNVIDIQPPTAPTKPISSAITKTSFIFSWTASTDNIDVVNYEVFIGATSCGTTKSTYLTITGLTAFTTYAITVKAIDAAGNVSPASKIINVYTTTTHTNCGTIYSKGENLPTYGKSNLIDNDTSTFWMHQQGGGATSWIIYKFCSNNKYVINRYSITTGTLGRRDWDPAGWVLKGSNDSITWKTLDRKSGITYTAASRTHVYDFTNTTPYNYYKLDSITDTGSDWLQLAELEFFEGASIDTIAPSIPTGLGSSNINSTSFTLSWSASTDNIGIKSYEVFKDGKSVGITSNTTMNITGLTANTLYSMTVKASDGINSSAASTTLNVITLITGIRENESFVKIYPNPANNEITVQLQTNEKASIITVYNVIGKEVLHEQMTDTNNFQINISSLEEGIYFLKIEQGSFNDLTKLIIQR